MFYSQEQWTCLSVSGIWSNTEVVTGTMKLLTQWKCTHHVCLSLILDSIQIIVQHQRTHSSHLFLLQVSSLCHTSPLCPTPDVQKCGQLKVIPCEDARKSDDGVGSLSCQSSDKRSTRGVLFFAWGGACCFGHRYLCPQLPDPRRCPDLRSPSY